MSSGAVLRAHHIIIITFERWAAGRRSCVPIIRRWVSAVWDGWMVLGYEYLTLEHKNTQSQYRTQEANKLSSKTKQNGK